MTSKSAMTTKTWLTPDQFNILTEFEQVGYHLAKLKEYIKNELEKPSIGITAEKINNDMPINMLWVQKDDISLILDTSSSENMLLREFIFDAYRTSTVRRVFLPDQKHHLFVEHSQLTKIINDFNQQFHQTYQ